MSKPAKSLYARLASRFAHLALGAAAEEEECEDDKDEDTRAEGDKDKKDDEPKSGKKSGKKAGKKSGKAAGADEEEEDDESASAEEEDDDEEEDEKKRDRKACASAARASERDRWTAVMSSAEAKGRVPLACSLLADTDMSAEKIRGALTASPTESRQGLSARMAAVPRPDVGSPPPERPDPRSPSGQASSIVAAYKKASGG